MDAEGKSITSATWCPGGRRNCRGENDHTLRVRHEREFTKWHSVNRTHPMGLLQLAHTAAAERRYLPLAA